MWQEREQHQTPLCRATETSDTTSTSRVGECIIHIRSIRQVHRGQRIMGLSKPSLIFTLKTVVLVA